MTTGSIELRSGRWDWRVQRLPRGAIVVFQHRTRMADEMRTWISSPEAMLVEAKENALDPVSRTWDDGFGCRWRLSMSGPSAAPDCATDDPLWLIFESGSQTRSALVPAGTRLGDLSHGEISTLLNAAT